MAYHKRPLTTRICTRCHEPYQAVDRRRLYCSASCKVQACQSRRSLSTKSVNPASATTALGAAPASSMTLDWNLQNMAVLGTASAIGQLGVKLGEKVVKSFTAPPAPKQSPVEPARLVNPLDWLPAGLLTASAPRVPLELPALGQSFLFVELNYLGHKLYYQPSNRWLLWRAEPGKLLSLLSPEHVALVAEQIPYNDYRPSNSWLGSNANELKTLG